MGSALQVEKKQHEAEEELTVGLKGSQKGVPIPSMSLCGSALLTCCWAVGSGSAFCQGLESNRSLLFEARHGAFLQGAF